MFNKFELIGGAISIGAMALAIYLVQAETILMSTGPVGQSAQVAKTQESAVVIVGDSEDVNKARTEAYLQAVNEEGNFNRMVIDDIKIGTGEEVKKGDTVSVHYVGTLQGGEEFDNSRKRSEPFEFKVGEGMVIKGWEEGLIGMKVGGQRVLVIPPDMAYGDRGVGPIPGGATLVFSIELMEIL